jgi:putative transposase
MLLRLAYLGITNAFALLRLLPGSDRDKDAEIVVLRHQLAVLQPARRAAGAVRGG